MCNQKYTDREKGIWKEMCTNDEGDQNKHKVISYFQKKSHGQRFDIDGTVYIPKEHLPEIILDAEKCFAMISDRLYVKGKRKQLRKVMYEEMEHNQYDWAALLHYLRQAYEEGTGKVVLSRKEYAMLQKPKTKKEKRDSRLKRSIVQY